MKANHIELKVDRVKIRDHVNRIFSQFDLNKLSKTILFLLKICEQNANSHIHQEKETKDKSQFISICGTTMSKIFFSHSDQHIWGLDCCACVYLSVCLTE